MCRTITLLISMCIMSSTAFATAVELHFCQYFLDVATSSFVASLPASEKTFFQQMRNPYTDIDGTATIDKRTSTTVINITGNGIPDCCAELSLLQAVLADTSINFNGGISHDVAYTAWTTNTTTLATCFGSYWPILNSTIPGFSEILTGYLTIGGGIFTEYPTNYFSYSGAGGTALGMMELMGIRSGVPRPDLMTLMAYQQLTQFFGLNGDADGDGASNSEEYAASGGDVYIYTNNALDPTVFPSGIFLRQPNGGGTWYMNGTVPIRWNWNTASGEVKIKLMKGNDLCCWISGPIPNSGLFWWTIPITLTPGSDYRVWIHSSTNGAIGDISFTPFTIAQSPLTLTTPNGDESLVPGSTHTIRWTCSDPNVTEVKIKLFQNGNFVYWISGPITNSSSFNWTIPTSLTLGSGYRVQIYSAADVGIADVSDTTFSLVAPVVRMIHPNGGEQFAPGDPLLLTWTGDTIAAPYVKLKLFKGNDFVCWIYGGITNDGIEPWTFPSNLTLGADYRIQLYSYSDPTQIDYSDAPFTITNTRIRLITPNGNQTVTRNTGVPITWVSSGSATSSEVKIKLFRNGNFIQWISGPTTNDGEYAWKVPSTLDTGSGYKVQIYSADNSSIIDYSDAEFSIN